MFITATSQGQLQVKNQKTFDHIKTFFSGQRAWLHIFIPVPMASPKYQLVFPGGARKIGFSTWIPVKTKDLTVHGSHLLLSLTEMQWGGCRGLPFPLPSDLSLPKDSEFVISLREESSALWLASFGHVPMWEAARVQDLDKLGKQYQDEEWFTLPSAASFCHLLADDATQVGELFIDPPLIWGAEPVCFTNIS